MAAEESTGLTNRIAGVIASVIGSLLIAGILGGLQVAGQVRDLQNETRVLRRDLERIERKVDALLDRQAYFHGPDEAAIVRARARVPPPAPEVQPGVVLAQEGEGK